MGNYLNETLNPFTATTLYPAQTGISFTIYYSNRESKKVEEECYLMQGGIRRILIMQWNQVSVFDIIFYVLLNKNSYLLHTYH